MLRPHEGDHEQRLRNFIRVCCIGKFQKKVLNPKEAKKIENEEETVLDEFALHDNDARDLPPNCHVANFNEKKSKLIYRSHPLTWKEVIICTIKYVENENKISC